MKKYLVDINLPSARMGENGYFYQSREDGSEPVEIEVTVTDIVTHKILASTTLGDRLGQDPTKKGILVESKSTTVFPLTFNDLRLSVREEEGSELAQLSLKSRPEGHFTEIKVVEVRAYSRLEVPAS